MGKKLDIPKGKLLILIENIIFIMGGISYKLFYKFLIKPLSFILNRLYFGWIAANFTSVKFPFFILYPSFIKGSQYIFIGKNFRASHGFRIEAWDNYLGYKYHPKIIIGNNVSFSDNCHVGAISSISIGDNVLFGSNIYITDHYHGTVDAVYQDLPPISRPLYSKGDVIIEHNVWVGDGVVILPNVRIGHSCIIGANSVVTKSFPPKSVIGGSPARIIKEYLENNCILPSSVSSHRGK
jgi:acetyltransferase-like isoleucine patch superfamily enzyme